MTKQQAASWLSQPGIQATIHDPHTKEAVGVAIKALTELKRGFWYAIDKGEKGYSAGNFRCSVCGEPNAAYKAKPNYCPNCGSYNGETQP